MRIGIYEGEVAARFAQPATLADLANLAPLLARPEAVVLTDGRNRNVRLTVAGPAGPLDLAVKAFGPQRALKDWYDRQRGSKARRTWQAATHLANCGVGTPVPVGFLERWEGPRLKASYFLSVFDPVATTFTAELVRLFHEDPLCERFMTLLQRVADAVRAMHCSGFVHQDLGNQNILLHRQGADDWGRVQFIDLNRGRIKATLTLSDIARDLSRIYLPSDFLRVFREMYFGDVVPSEYVRWETRCRARYSWHSWTRPLRHPLRQARQRRTDAGKRVYPAERDMWVWDERSVQPINVLRSADRRRYEPATRHWRTALAALGSVPRVWAAYRELRAAAYREPVKLAGRIGVSVSARPAGFKRELALLHELGPVPVRVRFYHHETPAQWSALADNVRLLAEAGHAVTVALAQDRRAALAPDRWATFVAHVLNRVGDRIEVAEVGVAINRVKWGIWDYREYRRLLSGVAAVTQMGLPVAFMGPGCIDFEFPDVIAALGQVPPAVKFRALSHQLYVDRRGAPENRQGPFALIEKLALARAIARTSPACEDRLVISEVNWPILGTGVYSPVGSPYDSPGPRFNDPSVSEDVYADYLLRYLLIALCSGYAERVFWWQLVARGFGLVDDTDAQAWRRRPAFHALQRFLALLGPATFESKLDTPRGVHAFWFTAPDDQPICVAYTQLPSAVFPLTFSVGRAEDSLGNPVAVRDERVVVTGRPVYLFVRPR